MDGTITKGVILSIEGNLSLIHISEPTRRS